MQKQRMPAAIGFLFYDTMSANRYTTYATGCLLYIYAKAKYVQEPTTLEGGRARLTDRDEQSWHTSEQDVPFSIA